MIEIKKTTAYVAPTTGHLYASRKDAMLAEVLHWWRDGLERRYAVVSPPRVLLHLLSHEELVDILDKAIEVGLVTRSAASPDS